MIQAHAPNETVTLDEQTIEMLKANVRGRVIRPTDAEYDTARKVWNGMIDKHPALIVRCATAEDVRGALEFARAEGLTIAVRGGGHSLAGLSVCDSGLVIDLSAMKQVTVNIDGEYARAEAGLTLGELIAATEPYGLATTTGIMSETGIAGLTLGGGLGWLGGKFSLTCDNVRSFEVVTADGAMIRANAQENPDLYWALRGGGGNFGIVTAFDYRLHQLGPVLAGMVMHPLSRAREVLKFYREFAANCPDELTVYAGLLTSPDGHPAIGMLTCYSGALDDGERALAPLRRFGPPVIDLIQPMPYSKIFSFIDPTARAGRPHYERASAVKELSDDVIDALVTAAETRTSPLSMVLIQQFHGAAARVPVEATAFALREEHFEISQVASWIDGPAESHSVWVRQSSQRLQPYAMAGAYVNFLGDEDQARVRASYGPNYMRLVQLKNKYDPRNLFHMNQNIRPRVAEEW